jgi:hypothetical protein
MGVSAILAVRLNLPFTRRPATMIPMRNVGNETEAIRAIVKIITEQKALEKYQRAKEASVETLQDSMVYAYDEIIQVVKPFIDDEGSGQQNPTWCGNTLDA